MAESLKMGQEKKATMKGSILILLLSVVMLMYGIIGLSLDSKIPLLLCTLVMMFYGMHLKVSWNDMMKSAFKSISSSLEAMLIIMTIGMVIGSWVSGGTFLRHCDFDGYSGAGNRRSYLLWIFFWRCAVSDVRWF